MQSGSFKKTYCGHVWRHQYVHMSGNVRLCCITKENISNNNGQQFHVQNDSLEDIWNSDYVKQARLKMINGEPLEQCTRCYEHEKRGIMSYRDQGLENGTREKNIARTNADGSLNYMPSSMELHFGNMCNLKCKMCGQNYSNQIGKELLEIGETDKEFLSWVYKQSGNVNIWTDNLSIEYDWFKNIETKNKLIKFVSDYTTDLNIIGGEPTVIPEFYELLEYCDKHNTLKDKTLLITTNVTNVNPKMTKWLPKLKEWTVWASIDGLGSRTEYIRYPSNFDKIIENLNFYKKLIKEHSNGRITFCPAIQLLNIDQLDEILKWFIDFADGDFVGDGGKDTFSVAWTAQVWYPKICNYDIAPTNYKNKVADKLSKSIDFFKKYELIKGFYENQIKNLRQEHLSAQEKKSLQQSFIRYNDTQDKHRNKTNWRQLLPYLEETLLDSLK